MVQPAAARDDGRLLVQPPQRDLPLLGRVGDPPPLRPAGDPQARARQVQRHAGRVGPAPGDAHLSRQRQQREGLAQRELRARAARAAHGRRRGRLLRGDGQVGRPSAHRPVRRQPHDALPLRHVQARDRQGEGPRLQPRQLEPVRREGRDRLPPLPGRAPVDRAPDRPQARGPLRQRRPAGRAGHRAREGLPPQRHRRHRGPARALPLQGLQGVVRGQGAATLRGHGRHRPGARHQAAGQGTEGVRQLYWLSGPLGHPPLGWHPPDGYPDRADLWRSAGGTLARWNSHLSLAAGWWPDDLHHPSLASRLQPRHPKTYGALVDAVAAGLAMPRPTDSVRRAVSGFLGHPPGARLEADDEALGWRLPWVFALVLDSPAGAVR